MSRMIPQETADILRHFTDVSVRIYGIGCTIYIPQNYDSLDMNTIYTTHAEYTYVQYETEVFLEWSPDQRRLRTFGIFTEKDVPIIGWFANKFYQEGASEPEFDVNILKGSYFTVPLQFIPREADAEEFEIVDIAIRGIHEKVALKTYMIAPRRVR